MKEVSRPLIRVSIFGRYYDIKSGPDEEYIIKLANYVDSVMRDIANRTETLSFDRVAVLAALNIADEMYRERQKFREYIERLGQELEKVLEESS